jgi:hypothetical protein
MAGWQLIVRGGMSERRLDTQDPAFGSDDLQFRCGISRFDYHEDKTTKTFKTFCSGFTFVYFVPIAIPLTSRSSDDSMLNSC